MIYKLVNSQKIIGRIMENYVIDYSDFISRTPNWIFSAMRLLHIVRGYQSRTIEATVSGYKCLLPSETKILLGVSYEGLRLPRLDVINERVSDDMQQLSHSEHKYELSRSGMSNGDALGDGYIVTTFEEGDIKFYIKAFPLVKDIESNLWFPLIPDIEEVYDALEQYILWKLLTRGHKLGELSLKSPNEFINPAIAWKIAKKVARNAATKMDTDEREQVSKDIRTFLVDYNFYTQGNFNPTGGIDNTTETT